MHSTFGEPQKKRAKYDADMSLDEFQARYTSEDNSSFTKILDEENRVRKEKWDWGMGCAAPRGGWAGEDARATGEDAD